MGRKLSIYSVEKMVHGFFSGRPEHYHSFLALVDETALPAPEREYFTAEQEIHFMDTDGDDQLTAYVYTRERHNTGDLILTGYCGGEESEIQRIWNKALRFGVALKRLRPEFNKAAVRPWEFNCRSGVEAALKAMGLNYAAPDRAAHAAVDQAVWRTLNAGLYKDLLARAEGYLPPETGRIPPDDLQAENRRLSKALERLDF